MLHSENNSCPRQTPKCIWLINGPWSEAFMKLALTLIKDGRLFWRVFIFFMDQQKFPKV